MPYCSHLRFIHNSFFYFIVSKIVTFGVLTAVLLNFQCFFVSKVVLIFIFFLIINKYVICSNQLGKITLEYVARPA